ncbi:hypothetical protein BJX68DRAFT_211580 [Aspergillus pseudodeflectus]|uniref:Uncharacterized protein n=1 Tax=Aspergillus pseudodeflectus TaxID=176178 RepID=A0ABR4JEY8_9EURO
MECLWHLFPRGWTCTDPPDLDNGYAYVEHDNLLQAVRQKLSESNKQHLADSEKIHRLTQLLNQARDDASRRERSHRRELGDLYHRLNSIQMTQDKLSDDLILEQMHRLHQQLDNWIKACFKDQDKLAAALEPTADGFPRTRPQRHAWVQSCISGWIHQSVFSPYLPGLPGDHFDWFCGNVEAPKQHFRHGESQQALPLNISERITATRRLTISWRWSNAISVVLRRSNLNHETNDCVRYWKGARTSSTP